MTDSQRLYFRTLGEDHDITAETVGMDLRRALARGLCKNTNHFPKPCKLCLEIVEPLAKPVARAILHAGKYERGSGKQMGYAAAGSALDVLIKELT